MTIPTHLTPAELDALLEAARVATQEEWMLQDSNSWRRIGVSAPYYGDGNVICPANQRDGHPDLIARREDLEYIIAAQPATITRLVLMVQAQDKVWRTAVRERDAAAAALGEYYQRGAQNFRARVVRELRNQRAEIVPVEDAAVRIEDAVRLIESLPLVETEGE